MENTEKPAKPQKTVEEKLLRQLKILNFWITTFGTMMLLSMIVIGFFAYQAATYVKSASDKVTNIQQQTTQTLDVKSQLCSNNDQVSQLLRSSGYC
jgi:hypothetical protein